MYDIWESTKEMSKPQMEINIPMAMPWLIRRPPVYRYMKKEYVDAFFRDGSLRLSSFTAFAKHQDEQRLDTNEGSTFFANNDPITGTSMIAQIKLGIDTYVFCGSMRYTEDLKKAFEADSGFRINDPTAFGHEIARVLPGCLAGREGPCVYLNWKAIHRTVDATSALKLIQDSDGQDNIVEDLKKALFTMAGDEAFFSKEKKYEHQAEYRLLWKVESLSDFLEIKCPRAVPYCTRFEDLWAGV